MPLRSWPDSTIPCRELYRTLDDPGDNPLRTADAMPKPSAPLAFHFELNLALAAKEKAGEKITPPGLPLAPAEAASFVTTDCITMDRKPL